MNSNIDRIPRWLRWVAGVAIVLIGAIAVFLAVFDWNMLRGPISRQASLMSGRPIRIEGDLKVHLFSWTPSASIGGLKIGNPNWMTGGDLAQVQALNVSIKLLPLLIGHVELPLLDLEKPTISLYRDPAGHANWQGKSSKNAPLKLPPIEHFVINGGVLKLDDKKKKLSVASTIQSSETTAGGGGGSFELKGQGSINVQPFSVSLKGGALLNVRQNQPYAFDADVRAGGTRVTAHGALSRPFDFGQLNTSLVVSGPDFADLYALTGLALPNTGPYRLSGRLTRDNARYAFSGVSGRVGDSDLEGEFVADDSTGRPNLRADLTSRSLDFKDLGPLIGAKRRGGGAKPLQKPSKPAPASVAAPTPAAAGARLLPDATLDVSRLRSMDAVARYRAVTVKATPHLPLRGVSLDLTLDHGLLTIDPLSFALPAGSLSGSVRIDARGALPKDDIDLKLTNARFENFVGAKTGKPPLEGLLEARARLHGYGNSVHQAAATANGDVTLVAPRGRMQRVFAELLGVDVVKGLGLFLSKDQSDTGVRCAVANFHATNGRLSARTLVLDTDPVIVQGQGSVDMGSETLDLTLQGRPKHFQFVRFQVPISISGPIASPHIGVKPGKAATQAATSVALGVLLTPAAALLAFVDPGLARDADCDALITGAKAQGAPVKLSQTTPPRPGRH